MHYAWLIWSLLLLGIWVIVYFFLNKRDQKKEMLIVSFWTAILGLTELLFVPAYWSPPSLFNLAERTGFDLESLIFSFGIGGLAVILYDRIFYRQHQNMSPVEKHNKRHRFHFWVLLSAPLIFLILLLLNNFNPIYSAIIALLIGGLLTWYCRPDLKIKMLVSAAIFLIFYFIYFLTLILMFPGYVEAVWNLKAISGILVWGIPLEELLFALSFGFFWSSVYEHLTWRKIKAI